MGEYNSRGGSGRVFNLPAPVGGAVAWTFFMLGELFGVWTGDGAEGDTVVLAALGEYELPKDPTVAATRGGRAYWDATAERVTPTPTGKPIGTFTEAALLAATTGWVNLVPGSIGNPLLVPAVLEVQDDDSAASNGTAVTVTTATPGTPDALLESTTAGDSSTIFQWGENGPTCYVGDNDSPAGGQVYVDHDATDPAGRLMHAGPNQLDYVLKLSDGRVVIIAYNAAAASLGVALYIDDDATNLWERLLAVSPSNADFAIETSRTRSWLAAV